MKNNFGIYFLALLGIGLSLIAYIIILKISGNIGLVPLFISSILGISSFILAKYRHVNSIISKVCIILSIIGFVVFFVFTKDAEIIEDEKQIIQQEETSKFIESGDELDNALDDL